MASVNVNIPNVQSGNVGVNTNTAAGSYVDVSSAPSVNVPSVTEVNGINIEQSNSGYSGDNSSESYYTGDSYGYAPTYTPTYAPTYASEEQPIMAAQSAQPTRQAEQPEVATRNNQDAIRTAREEVRSALGQMTKASPVAAPMGASDTRDVSMRSSGPLESTAKSLEQIAKEDTPLPNASTRNDLFSAEDLAAAAEYDRASSQQEIPVEEMDRAESAYEKEEARKTAKRIRSAMSRSVTKQVRTKPSIVDRLIGRTPRRKAQLSTDNMPTHRPAKVIRQLKDRLSDAFGKHGVGYRIYGKMVPLPTLDFREIGVGLQEISAVIEQNPEMFDNLIKANIPASELTNFTTTRSMRLSDVADLVNTHEVYVFTAKAPNNRGQDVQRRILRILESEQRGIYLHPTMAAMYTADFDGDDMLVSLDPSLINNAKDPMEHMLGVDGEQSLDTNLLPVSNIEDGYEEGKSAEDFVVEVMLGRWAKRSRGIAESQFDDVVDKVLKLSETALKGSDSQAVAWGDLFRSARSFADAMANGRNARNRIMSGVINDVYKSMKSIGVDKALMTIGEIVPRDYLPDAFTPSDNALYKVIDGMVMGAVPNNFQELKVMMSGFLGNVQGKSAPFRFTADVGKMMKLDSRMRIGSEYVVDPENDQDMSDFLQATVKFAYSKRMAVDVKKQGKSMYFTDVLRQRVINEVGFPDAVDKDGNRAYENYADFIWTFAESYNRNAALINEANLVWLSNMAISSNSNRKTVSVIRNVHNGKLAYKDIASPFIEVYGTYSFDRMFGEMFTYQKVDERAQRVGGPNKTEVDWRRTSNGRHWIKSRYKDMSLRSFSTNNHITMESKERSQLIDEMIPHGDEILGVNDMADFVDSLIAAIADKRTSTTSKFNIDVIGSYQSRDGIRKGVRETGTGGKKTMISMMKDLLMDIRNADLEGLYNPETGTFNETSLDQMLFVDDAIMALNASGYDMFRNLGMDSTAGFLNSEYGRALIRNADNADMIASIREAMVFADQTSRVTRIADQLRELDTEVNPSVERYMDLKNQAVFAMDELASKSIVWQGIVSELRSKVSDSAFKQLRTTEGRRGISWMAPDFWTSETSHSSLKEVIEDLSMPWPIKCDIITDVVRWQTQDCRVNNFEVAYQMEVGGDSRFSSGTGGPKASLLVYNDTESEFRRYANRSLRNLRKEVSEAAKHHKNKQGHLTNTIHRLATSPWELIEVDDRMYADVILAVRDKVYAQTEKAQKHPATNAAYSALSNQRNGGFFNDVYRFDDRMLGLQHTSQLSAGDLIRILDDPNYMLTVYDDYGSIGYLDQQTLLGIDHEASEQDIWNWMIANPRMACMLRASAACVIADTKSRGYVGSRLSLDETINSYGDGGHDLMGHIKYLMRDHPVYAGLISMLTPAHGSVARNDRNKMPKVEEAVCHEFYRAAAMDGEMAASKVLENFGITRTKLRDLLTSDFDKYMSRLGFGWDTESIEEAQTEADDIYDVLERHIAGYIAEIRRETPFDPGFFSTFNISTTPDIGIDIESVASFWDAVQELSGAKVGVSTGIEGAETYQLSYWVSHMGAKDHYANLEAIAELIEDSDDPSAFDGMWTDHGTLQVSVDENGNVSTNINDLVATKTNDGEEIVTRVPDGFDVPDRSTDSYGMPVPSLYVSMVSKRSNGAEKFNLKAMKAGLDGTDSVTKMKGGKYLTEQYADGSSSNVLFFQISERLSEVAMSQGIDVARMQLAKMMMEQDAQMGYKDMTLANYMSIAEIMLIEDPEGGTILRSLEQIVSGLKGRIGSSVDEMTDEQVTSRIKEIMSDTTDQGIGKSMVWDAYELMSYMRPNGVADDAKAHIKTSSSVFSRNYDLLKKIEQETGLSSMDWGERSAIHDQIIGMTDKDGVNGVKEVWKRSNILRNYQVIGYAAAQDGSQMLNNRNIGPSTAIIIGTGNVDVSVVAKICDDAYARGTTVIVSAENASLVPDDYAADMIPVNDLGDMMIPMFDARLNGSEARPFEPRFGIFKVPMDRYVISVEDPMNVFELGDAQYKFTQNMVSRMHMHQGDSVQISAEDLFPNVFKNIGFRNSSENYHDAEFSVTLASKETVKNFICNPDGPTCTIDYGLVEGSEGFGQRVRDVNAAIRRYADMIDLADDQDSVLRGIDYLAPGDIVAWADITISRDNMPDEHVLAPIIPFMLSGGTKVPESFKCVQVDRTNNDGSLFTVDWSVDTDFFEGDYIKYFDSSGGANKGMINLSDVIQDTMRLKNGMNIDAYCASFSTDSRKVGTDRRIKTMISLMSIARMMGYNFADVDGAFPNDPELRDALSKNGRLPMKFWATRYKAQQIDEENPIVFHSDPKLNAFVDYECKKIFADGGNPSDYLVAQAMNDENGNRHEYVMWEFECMFDNSLNYEDSLLKFLHTMNPQLCPNGIDDPTEDTYFRLYREGKEDLGSGFDRGMLQMQVPYPMSDGRISYVWSNVFVGMSFFGEEWSRNSRPNVSGASDMLDGENTMSHYGVKLSRDKAKKRAAWATAGEGRFIKDAGALGLG